MRLPDRYESWITHDGVRALVARAPKWVTIALALAIVAQAALIVNDLAMSARLGEPQASGGQRSDAAHRHALEIATLVNSHLFGAVAPLSDTGTAPASRAPLVLAGVLALEDPARGFAILGDAVTHTKLYMVGASVPDGATLRAVFRDRVVLDRAGALETLFFPKGAPSGGAYAHAGRSPAAEAQTPEGENTLRGKRSLTAMDSRGFGELLKPEPVTANGKQTGYRLHPGKNFSAFMQAGLVNGDVVTSINGTALDDPQRAAEMLRSLDATSEAHFTVLRNGREKELVLNLAALGGADGALAGTPN